MSQTQYEMKKRLDEKLVNAPASVRTSMLRTFDRLQFATSQDFEDYLTEAESTVAGINQEIADRGLAESAHKPNVGGGSTGVSAGIQNYIKQKPGGVDDLGGREI